MIVGKYIIYQTGPDKKGIKTDLWMGVLPTHANYIRSTQEDLERQGQKVNLYKDVQALGTFFYNEFTKQLRVKPLMCRGFEGNELDPNDNRTSFFETHYKKYVVQAWADEIKNDTQADIFKKADMSDFLMKQAAERGG